MENNQKPEIRFGGFNENWELRKLGEVATILAGGDVDKNKLSSSGNYPVLANALTNEGVVGYYNNEYRIEGPAVTVTGRGDVGHAKSRKYNFTPVVRLLAVKSEYDVDFLESAINNHKITVESTGVPQLTSPQLGNYKIYFPTVSESEKIGGLLNKLTIQINNSQQELETLKQTKKGFLQKMFPKEGESVPEVRFSGFTGDWEQRKLREMLADPVTDGPHETPKLEESGIPFISVDAIVDNQIDFDRKRGYISEETDELYSKKYRPQYHDVFLVKSGSTVGKTAIVETKERFNIWSPLAAMRVGEVSDPYFLYFLLQTRKVQNQVKDKASSGTQPNLGMRELEKFHTQITPNLDEQKKIGAFFQQLDNLITLHQRELDALKETKKAFLQKMFV